MKKICLLYVLSLSMVLAPMSAQAEIAPSCQALLTKARQGISDLLGLNSGGKAELLVIDHTDDFYELSEENSSIDTSYKKLIQNRDRMKGLTGYMYGTLLSLTDQRLQRTLRKTDSEYGIRYDEIAARAHFFTSPKTYQRFAVLRSQKQQIENGDSVEGLTIESIDEQLIAMNQQVQAAEDEINKLMAQFTSLEKKVRMHMLENAVAYTELSRLEETKKALKANKAVRVLLPAVAANGSVHRYSDSFSDDRASVLRLENRIRKLKLKLRDVGLHLVAKDFIHQEEKDFAEAARKLRIYSDRIQTHKKAGTLNSQLEDEYKDLQPILNDSKFMEHPWYKVALMNELVKDEKARIAEAKKGNQIKAEGRIFEVIDNVFGKEESQKLLDEIGINKYKDLPKQLLSKLHKRVIAATLMATLGAPNLVGAYQLYADPVMEWGKSNIVWVEEKFEIEKWLGFRESAKVKELAAIKDPTQLQTELISLLRTHFPTVAEDMEDGTFDSRRTAEADEWVQFIIALNTQRMRNMLLEDQLKFNNEQDQKAYDNQMILIKEILGEASMNQVEKVFIAIIEESTTVNNKLSDEFRGQVGKTFEAAAKNYLHEKYPELSISDKVAISKALATLNTMNAINVSNESAKVEVLEMISYRTRVIQYTNRVSNPDYEHFALTLINSL